MRPRPSMLRPNWTSNWTAGLEVLTYKAFTQARHVCVVFLLQCATREQPTLADVSVLKGKKRETVGKTWQRHCFEFL